MEPLEPNRHKGGYCRDCGDHISWKESLHMGNVCPPEEVNYCPIHGTELTTEY